MSWVLGLGNRARILEPPELVEEAEERVRLVVERHEEPIELAAPVKRRPKEEPEADAQAREHDPARALRSPRHARRDPDRHRAPGSKLELAELCETLQMSEQELRQDIDVLNVVNFGGGSYVLYAEVQGDQIEVDPEPYGDNFARPARLLPLEAKALAAAIDLVGEHLPEGSLTSAREKIVDALGHDPATDGLQITTAKGDDSEIARVVSGAIAERRLLEIEHYKEDEDEFTSRTIEPYQLHQRHGGLVRALLRPGEGRRRARSGSTGSAPPTVLDETYEPPRGRGARDGRAGRRPARCRPRRPPGSGSRPSARAGRSEDRAWSQELNDGAVIVELSFGGTRLPGSRDPQGSRRRRRARARGRPRGGPRGRRGAGRHCPPLTPAGAFAGTVAR